MASKVDMKDAAQETVFVPIKAPRIDASMVVRTIVFLLSLINAIAGLFGFHWNLKIDQEMTYNIVSAAFLFGSSIYAAWKNNNITKKARIKQAVADQVVIKK